MQKLFPRIRVIMRSLSSDIETQEEEEVASENGNEAEGTQESDDTENDSQEKERKQEKKEKESSSLETSTTFYSKSPCEYCENSNVYGKLIMECPKCF